MRSIENESSGLPFLPFGSQFRTLDLVTDWVENGERLGVIAGVSGIGKTRLLRESARRLKAPRLRVVSVTGTSDESLMVERILVAAGFGMGKTGWNSVELGFKATWLQGSRTVLLIDDADALSGTQTDARLRSLAAASLGRMTILLAVREIPDEVCLIDEIRSLTRSESESLVEACLGADLKVGPRGMSRVHALCRGVPGSLVRLLRACRRIAWEQGEDELTESLIDTALNRSEGWVSGWYPGLAVG